MDTLPTRARRVALHGFAAAALGPVAAAAVRAQAGSAPPPGGVSIRQGGGSRLRQGEARQGGKKGGKRFAHGGRLLPPAAVRGGD